METFEAVIGGGLIVLAFVALGAGMQRYRREDTWEGMHLVAVANAGIGVFLLAYGLPWSGPLATATILISAIIGFSFGVAFIVYIIRLGKKDLFS
ncbi:hypothetical protein [Actinomadura algeriensis]|uniref:Uncharacterized protein n=1 Tax=Actinomadura algeriensis TaxID=1679523 RepID=A0ABR9JS11_9ACTN|nr:hypothetical protein [Actinomadura algeriensis]MBE1533347.1 hypothetical protein [Actinomadura algeriensis]